VALVDYGCCCGHRISLLAELNTAGLIDWSRAARLASVGGNRGPNQPQSGRSSQDRLENTTATVDGGGVPLTATLTGAQRDDATQLMLLIEKVPPVRRRRSRSPKCLEVLYADRTYDYGRYRDLVQDKGIQPQFAERGAERGSGLSSRWSSNTPPRCCTGSAACVSAKRSAMTSMRPSSASACDIGSPEKSLSVTLTIN
jgi:hypothetical protein